MGRSKPDDVKVTTSGGLSVIGEITLSSGGKPVKLELLEGDRAREKAKDSCAGGNPSGTLCESRTDTHPACVTDFAPLD